MHIIGKEADLLKLTTIVRNQFTEPAKIASFML